MFFCWANKNEMSFDINKYDTMIIKPLKFVLFPGYKKPTFPLSMYSVPKESVYIFLGIPFSNDFFLKPFITYMNTKVRKTLFSFSSFFFI